MYVALFLAGAGLVAMCICLAPPILRRRVESEARRIDRAAGTIAPSDDWPTLYARLRAREIGGAVGYSVSLPLGALVWEQGPPMSGVAALLVYATLPAVGAMVGHAWSMGLKPGLVRVAELRDRRLGDYLTPAERGWTLLAAAVPLAGVGLGWSSAAQPDGNVAGVTVAAVSAAALGVGLLSVPLVRRVLETPPGTSTGGGVVWAEVLRAVMLRDIVSGCWTAAVIVPALALWYAVTDSESSGSWWGPGCYATIGLAVVVLAALGWAGIRDYRHRWARRHVQVGVAP